MKKRIAVALALILLLAIFFLYRQANGLPPGDPTLNTRVCARSKWYDGSSAAEYLGNGLCHFFCLSDAMRFATENSKPLLVVFTGHTSSSVRFDYKMSESLQYASDRFVRIDLHVDDPSRLAEPVLWEGEKIRTVGDLYLTLEEKMLAQNAQPYFIILSPQGHLLPPDPVGYTPDYSDMKSFLDEGYQNFMRWQKDPSDQIWGKPVVPNIILQVDPCENPPPPEPEIKKDMTEFYTRQAGVEKILRASGKSSTCYLIPADTSLVGWKISIANPNNVGVSDPTRVTFTLTPDISYHLFPPSQTLPEGFVFEKDIRSVNAYLSSSLRTDSETRKNSSDSILQFSNGEAISYSLSFIAGEPGPFLFSGWIAGQVCNDAGNCKPLSAQFVWMGRAK